MSDMDLTPEDARSIEAAEYVLGLTDLEERTAAERRIASDPSFAADVAWWEAHFAPWLTEYSEVAPPARLWARIEQELARVSGGEPGSTSPHSPAADPANDNAVPAWWRVYGLGMSAVAAGLLALLMFQPGPQPLPQPVEVAPPEEPQAQPINLLTARVSPEGGIPVAVITYDPSSRRLIVSPVQIPADAAQSPELWFIPGDGTPRSLGLIDASEGRSVQLPETFDTEATLAVSLEPEGGSPTGLPTGPIIGTGNLSSL